MRNSIKIVLVIGTVLIMAVYILVLLKFTAVYPAIKEYKFTTTVPGLERKILDLVKDNQKYGFTITDTVGNAEPDYHAELRIEVQGKRYKYIIMYFAQTGFLTKVTSSKLDLIGAYNETDNFGGFKMEDRRMIGVVRIFDQEFIEKLQ